MQKDRLGESIPTLLYKAKAPVLEIAYEEGIEDFQFELLAENIHTSPYKRLFDVLFAGLVLIFVFSWLYPLIAVLIKASSKGPVLFVQKRIGFKGRIFNCYKFRTMKVIPYSLKYTPTSYNDPRITRIGKFLRKTNLDEFPQFINVLMGHMSIVGPRPHAIAFHNTYSTFIDSIDRRHMVKPGITGLAQIYGFRGDSEDSEENKKRTIQRIEYDIEYIRKWSFRTDIRIINRTCFQMIVNKTNGR